MYISKLPKNCLYNKEGELSYDNTDGLPYRIALAA